MISIDLNLLLTILSIIAVTIGAIVAIIKIYSKLMIILNDINNNQIHTNERLTKIETMMMDYDSRIDENASNVEEVKHEVEMINQKLELKGV